MKGFFVCATDTGVGKTVISSGISMVLKEKGYDAGVMKPVQSGCNDAEFLIHCTGSFDDISLVNPYSFTEPISPHLASLREKKKIERTKIKQSFLALSKKHDLMIVEGAGGILVPLGDDFMICDVICDIDLPVIIIARPGLGTINHTLLTINHLRTMGQTVAGVVINYSAQVTYGISEKTNPEVIEKESGVSVLGIMPYLKTIDVELLKNAGLKEEVEKKLDWKRLLSFL